MSRLAKETAPAQKGHQERDQASQMVYVADQTRAVTEYRYDPRGNLKRTISPGGRVTENEYDNRNELITTSLPDPMNGFTAPATMPAEAQQRPVIRYEYDMLGNRASVSDPRDLSDGSGQGNGKVRTQYGYDAAGRIRSVASPKPTGDETAGIPLTFYTYYGDGQIESTTAPGPNRPVATTFQYDVSPGETEPAIGRNSSSRGSSLG